MSGGLKVLQMDELDVSRLLTATTHIGSTNVNYQMQQYVFKRRPDGVNIVDLRKTYEKLLLAARAIAAIENPSDVFVISSRPMGQRAVLKYARYTGATPIAGRFTPGAFTNQIQAAFREPRLLVVTDPLQDHQPVNEASYVNIPVLAFANTDSPLKYVDIAIPCNNKSAHSVGLMWWMLAREVLRLRGTISRSVPWEEEVMPDLFFYRDADEQEKEETARQEEVAKPEPIAEEATTEEAATEEVAGSGAPATLQQMITTDPSRIAGASADEKPATNWAGEAAAPSDWAAQPTGTSENWGGDSTSWA